MKTNEILQKWCRSIYYCGMGNYWYENENDNKLSYKIYSFVLYCLFSMMTVLELMAVLFGDLPDGDKNDCIAMTLCHIIIMIKILMIVANKNVLRVYLNDVTKACEIYEDQAIMNGRYKIVKITVIACFAGTYIAVFCYVIQGFQKLYQGLAFGTVVTYYPAYNDFSGLACIFRVSTTILLAMFMLPMIFGTDGFVIVNLIIMKYKFVTLRNYFEALRQLKKSGSKKAMKLNFCKELNDKLIKGIAMHKELIRLTRVLEEQFSPIFGIQLCEAVGSAVTLLLQVTVLEGFTLVIAAKAFFFSGTVYLLLGLFLCNAGEITYEASLLPEAIFYSGWHLCQTNLPIYNNTRRLVILAIAQAQRPLTIRTFKMLDLTYGSFLQVLKTTYSIFALVYSQYK